MTAYNRIDDLLAHTDILRFCPITHEIIPIWMREDVPDYFRDEMKCFPHAHYCDGIKFSIGPLLGLVSGLRKARDLGLDYVIYRNGDDWLFNHDFVQETLEIMHNKDVAGYNWLSCGTMAEFAMNELWLRVDKFAPSVDEAERYFLSSTDKYLCELKISKWIRQVLDKDFSRFYRLPHREVWPGVGFQRETLPQVFAAMGETMPDEFLEKMEDNHRWFNRKWQLIGSHSNSQRYRFYWDLRRDIPYGRNLEKENHFARWLTTIGTTSWNLPEEKSKEPNPQAVARQPLLLRRLPHRTIPKMLPKRRPHCGGINRSDL